MAFYLAMEHLIPYTFETYLSDDLIQVQDVIGETLALPSGTRLLVGERIAIVVDGGILDDPIEQPELLPHFCPQQIFVLILGDNNHSTEAT